MNHITEALSEGALEWLGRCPICNSSERTVLHAGLTDETFFCAPGRWTLYRCDRCRTGYLDPRLNRENISLAYREYYTHGAEAQDTGSVHGLGRVMLALRNGYKNYRFGTNESPAWRLGAIMMMLMPWKRGVHDALGRHLERASPGARLLDVGCGNGDFLDLARHAGWEVVGIEPDPRAAAAAAKRGINVVQGDVSALDSEDGSFDAITISHVIEHVHDPHVLLRACYRLLKPGGWIWLETPNLDALGHKRYGAHWRGLEAPRHLVIFAPSSLRLVLEEAGFQNVENQPYRPLCEGVWSISEAVAKGLDPNSHIVLGKKARRDVQAAELLARSNPNVREFITVKAWKSPVHPTDAVELSDQTGRSKQ